MNGPGERGVLALGPVRHACHACGACCHGWRVHLLAGEAERVEEHGRALGVEHPVDPIGHGLLRQVDGRCVFLGEDRLCRIHVHFGGAAKPRVCQLYPALRIAAEDGLRVGADPSCSSTWRSFREGPTLDLAGVAPIVDGRSEEGEAEAALLALLARPGLTLAGLVRRLAAGPDADAGLDSSSELPPGYLARALGRVRAAAGLLEDRAIGAVAIADLEGVRRMVSALPPGEAPAWRESPEVAAFALEVARRTLFLRVMDPALPPVGQVLVVLLGALACGAAHDTLEAFGPALSAWSRASRLPGAWRVLVPDAATMRGLLSP